MCVYVHARVCVHWFCVYVVDFVWMSVCVCACMQTVVVGAVS